MLGSSTMLKWKEKTTEINPLHAMCSRVCSFPPALPRYFIEHYSRPGNVFLDSFCGKGTAPLEAALMRRKAIGNDISPEAFIVTKAKLNPLSLERFNEKLEELENKMNSVRSTNDVDGRVKIFFHPVTMKQIMKIRKLLLQDDSKEATFVKGILLGILHGSTSLSLSLRCSHSYSMSPNYVKKYAKEHGLKRPERDLISSLRSRGQELLQNNELTFEGTALNCDSRELPLEDKTVDLALFSPPYLDIQTYAYDNWLRLWFLGYDYKEVRKTIMQTGSLELYKQFMFDSIYEVYRLLKKGKSCFIIVGDVKRRTAKGEEIVDISKHLSELSSEIGFKVKNIIEDWVPSNRKSMIHTKSCGITKEKIIHLLK